MRDHLDVAQGGDLGRGEVRPARSCHRLGVRETDLQARWSAQYPDLTAGRGNQRFGMTASIIDCAYLIPSQVFALTYAVWVRVLHQMKPALAEARYSYPLFISGPGAVRR